jgi:hypothetical protein
MSLLSILWVLWPDIPKFMIYNITIESHAKLLFTMGSNIVASLLITPLPD